jgi:hypothetical protein
MFLASWIISKESAIGSCHKEAFAMRVGVVGQQPRFGHA